MCSVGFIELAREQFLAEYEAVGIKMSTFKSSQKWVEWFPDRVQINKFILKKWWIIDFLLVWNLWMCPNLLMCLNVVIPRHGSKSRGKDTYSQEEKARFEFHWKSGNLKLAEWKMKTSLCCYKSRFSGFTIRRQCFIPDLSGYLLLSLSL